MAALTPARLAKLLTDAAAALEREARAAGGSSSGSGVGSSVSAGGIVVDAATIASMGAVQSLQRACQLPDDAAAAAGAGRVPLPAPSAEVDAALSTLARLIAAGCAAPAAAAVPSSYAGAVTRRVSYTALQAVTAVAFSSPRRAEALARHTALMREVAAALGARDDAVTLMLALGIALSLLSQANRVSGSLAPDPPAARRTGEGSAANLRALAAALAGAFPAIQGGHAGAAFGRNIAEFEGSVCANLSEAIVACEERDRLGFCATLLQQQGFVDAICACIAREAAAVPPLTALRTRREPPQNGALILAVALGSGGAVDVHFNEALQAVAFLPRLEAGPPPPEMQRFAEQLLAAAPALLERVVDVLAAGAPWYEAVAAALGPGAATGGGDDLGRLVSRFGEFQDGLWAWAVALLRLIPLHALTGGSAAGHGPIARLAPLLLGLAEAAQAVAGVPLGPRLAGVTAADRGALARLAATALYILEQAVRARGAALLDAAPSALAALVRLSVSQPPLLADSSPRGVEIAKRVVPSLLTMHIKALSALTSLSAGSSTCCSRLAALLAASPALLAALGAAVGATPSERRFASADVSSVVIVAERRALAAALLAQLAMSAANGVVRDASCLRALAG